MADISKHIVSLELRTRNFARGLDRVTQRVDRFSGRMKALAFTGLAFFGISETTQLVERLGQTMVNSGGLAGQVGTRLSTAFGRVKRTVIGLAQAVVIRFAPAIEGAANFLAVTLPKAAAKAVNSFTRLRARTLELSASVLRFFGANDTANNLVARASKLRVEFERNTAATEKFVFALGKAVKLEGDLTSEKEAQRDLQRAIQAQQRAASARFLQIDPVRTALGIGGQGMQTRAMVEEQKRTNKLLGGIALNLSSGGGVVGVTA